MSQPSPRDESDKDTDCSVDFHQLPGASSRPKRPWEAECVDLSSRDFRLPSHEELNLHLLNSKLALLAPRGLLQRLGEQMRRMFFGK